jgi:hypothetical protein
LSGGRHCADPIGAVGHLATRLQVDGYCAGRIARDRETAISRYLKDLDARALAGTMARLDIEEAEACEASPMDFVSMRLPSMRMRPARLIN